MWLLAGGFCSLPYDFLHCFAYMTWQLTFPTAERKRGRATKMAVELNSPLLECVLDLVTLPKTKIWKGKSSNPKVEKYSRYQINQVIKVNIASVSDVDITHS